MKEYRRNKLIAATLLSFSLSASASIEISPFRFTAMNPSSVTGSMKPYPRPERVDEYLQNIKCKLDVRKAISGSQNIPLEQSLELYPSQMDPTWNFFNLESQRKRGATGLEFFDSKASDKISIIPAVVSLESSKELWLYVQFREGEHSGYEMRPVTQNPNTGSFGIKVAKGSSAMISGQIYSYHVSCN